MAKNTQDKLSAFRRIVIEKINELKPNDRTAGNIWTSVLSDKHTRPDMNLRKFTALLKTWVKEGYLNYSDKKYSVVKKKGAGKSSDVKPKANTEQTASQSTVVKKKKQAAVADEKRKKKAVAKEKTKETAVLEEKKKKKAKPVPAPGVQASPVLTAQTGSISKSRVRIRSASASIGRPPENSKRGTVEHLAVDAEIERVGLKKRKSSVVQQHLDEGPLPARRVRTRSNTVELLANQQVRPAKNGSRGSVVELVDDTEAERHEKSEKRKSVKK